MIPARAKEHDEHHFMGSALVRDVVIGMSDGLTVPFALAAGLAGARAGNGMILTAGMAELVAGAISMGLGGYLAGRTEVEHYEGERRREYREVEEVPEEEKKEVRVVFSRYGLSKDSQDRIVEELAGNKKSWVDFMMRFELGLEEPDEKSAAWTALRIGGSYAVGGLIPLSAYFVTQDSRSGLGCSSALTLVALGVFGYLKSHLIGHDRVKGAVKFMVVGTVAAATAYFIASRVKF